MKSKVLACILLVSTLLAEGAARAQEPSDFGIWQSINLKGKVSNTVSLGFWTEHRSKTSARDLDCALVMPYVNYTPLKWLQLGYASEYIIAASGRYVTCRPSATLLLGSGPLSFQFRVLPIYEHSLDSGTGTWTLRTRGKVACRIADTAWKPYMSCELFTAGVWKKTRYCAGTTWSFGRHSGLDLFYMYYVMGGSTVRERHILGVGYSFSI